MCYSFRSVLIATISVLFLGPLAAASGQMQKQPKIELSHDHFYFGYMPQGVMVKHSYWIRNKGNDTLQIISVKPGCGCTTAPLSKDLIAPDDSAELTVTFDSKNMVGSTVKYIEILSNDPLKSATRVQFVAMVNRGWGNVKVVPDGLRFAKFGSKDGKLTKSVEIQNVSDEAIEISLVDFPERLLKIDKKQGKIAAGGKLSFEFEQTRDVKDESEIMNSVTFELIGKETDRITIPVVAYFQK